MASTRTASRFRAPRSHAASASTQRHDPTPRCASFPQRHGRIHEEPAHAPAASFAAWVGSEGSAATALERALSEYGGGRGAALPEFVGEGGGEGIFCVPLRAVMLLGRPPALEVIPGVPKIKDDYNPSTWMLEVTSISMEKQLGVNFVAIYRESTTYKDNDEMVKQLSIPSSGTSDLHFKAQFPQTFMEQFKACLWKQFLSHWRTPSYNLVRIVFIALSCLMFGALYWQKGNIDNINNQQGLFTVLGCMYCTTLYTGIKNSQSVMPFVSIERSVMYRERFSGMYSPWAYSFAQLAMEIPFVLVQLLIFMLIAYPMIGYEWTITKVLWFSYSMFCTMLYFVYLGMMVVSLTPNMQVATILASLCYTILNLMSGFIVPGPQVPKWWIWLYRISPMPWTLNLFFTTQLYGDDKYITVFGEAKSISKFSKDYFGFHHALVPQTAVMLAVFPVLFGLVFAFSISKLNFQRR